MDNEQKGPRGLTDRERNIAEDQFAVGYDAGFLAAFSNEDDAKVLIVALEPRKVRWLCFLLRGFCSDIAGELEGQELVERLRELINLEIETPMHTHPDSRARAAYACAEFQREKEEDPND